MAASAVLIFSSAITPLRVPLSMLLVTAVLLVLLVLLFLHAPAVFLDKPLLLAADDIRGCSCQRADARRSRCGGAGPMALIGSDAWRGRRDDEETAF
jgi:hypothetical protein